MIGRYTERKIRKEIGLQETGAIPPVEDNAKAVRVTWESLIGDPSVSAPTTYVLFPTEECIVTSECKPCCVCGRPTNLIGICYESYFCSNECIEKMDKKFKEWEESCTEEEEF